MAGKQRLNLHLLDDDERIQYTSYIAGRHKKMLAKIAKTTGMPEAALLRLALDKGLPRVKQMLTTNSKLDFQCGG